MRSCGRCSLCCKLLAIPELDKPQHVWCQHARPGKGGCHIHGSPERPAICGSFQCAWLEREDGLGDELRPDRIHAVLTGDTKGTGVSVVCDPNYPQAWKTEPLAAVLRKLTDRGVRVSIGIGSKRFVMFAGQIVRMA